MDYQDSDVNEESKPTAKTTTGSRPKLTLKKRSSRVRYVGEPLPTTITSATTPATTITTFYICNQPPPLPSIPSTSTNVTIVPETPLQRTNQLPSHPSNTPLLLLDEVAGV